MSLNYSWKTVAFIWRKQTSTIKKKSYLTEKYILKHWMYFFFGMRCCAGKEGTGECCDLRVTRKSWNSAWVIFTFCISYSRFFLFLYCNERHSVRLDAGGELHRCNINMRSIDNAKKGSNCNKLYSTHRPFTLCVTVYLANQMLVAEVSN